MAEHGPSEAPLPGPLSPWAVFDFPEALCALGGHEWAEAGGGLLICATCEAEKWAESSSPDREGAENGPA